MTDESDRETDAKPDPSAEQEITDDEPGPGVEPVDDEESEDESEEDRQQERERRRGGGEVVEPEDDE